MLKLLTSLCLQATTGTVDLLKEKKKYWWRIILFSLLLSTLKQNEMNNNEILEARAYLGKEFDYIPDKSIELMIRCFDLIAKLLMEKIARERE